MSRGECGAHYAAVEDLWQQGDCAGEVSPASLKQDQGFFATEWRAVAGGSAGLEKASELFSSVETWKAA